MTNTNTNTGCKLPIKVMFQTYMSLLGFCMGFTMYGSLSLIGTIAVETAPIHITGSAQAVMALAAAGEYLLTIIQVAYNCRQNF